MLLLAPAGGSAGAALTPREESWSSLVVEIAVAAELLALLRRAVPSCSAPLATLSLASSVNLTLESRSDCLGAASHRCGSSPCVGCVSERPIAHSLLPPPHVQSQPSLQLCGDGAEGCVSMGIEPTTSLATTHASHTPLPATLQRSHLGRRRPRCRDKEVGVLQLVRGDALDDLLYVGGAIAVGDDALPLEVGVLRPPARRVRVRVKVRAWCEAAAVRVNAKAWEERRRWRWRHPRARIRGRVNNGRRTC